MQLPSMFFFPSPRMSTCTWCSPRISSGSMVYQCTSFCQPFYVEGVWNSWQFLYISVFVEDVRCFRCSKIPHVRGRGLRLANEDFFFFVHSSIFILRETSNSLWLCLHFCYGICVCVSLSVFLWGFDCVRHACGLFKDNVKCKTHFSPMTQQCNLIGWWDQTWYHPDDKMDIFCLKARNHTLLGSFNYLVN